MHQVMFGYGLLSGLCKASRGEIERDTTNLHSALYLIETLVKPKETFEKKLTTLPYGSLWGHKVTMCDVRTPETSTLKAPAQ